MVRHEMTQQTSNSEAGMTRFNGVPARYRVLLTMAVLVLGAGGCTDRRAGGPRGFDSATPSDRLEATRDAAAASDWDAIPDLIMGLESDDPTVRFMSIGTLNRLTGKKFGYRANALPVERQ